MLCEKDQILVLLTIRNMITEATMAIEAAIPDGAGLTFEQIIEARCAIARASGKVEALRQLSGVLCGE